MCKQTSDIRDFKRFINSVISISFNGEIYLNKRDLLAIEYIRLNNLSLYQKIYQYRKFFISHDKITNMEIYSSSFSKKEFNAHAKDFFKELFLDGENFNYIDLLEEIFPYVKKYKMNQDLEHEGYYFSDEEYPDIAKNRRMCSAKYFDLYFTNTDNGFLFVVKVVTSFVDNINQASDKNSRSSIFNTLLKSVHLSFHKEIFERFQLYVEELQEEVAFDMACILFDKIYAIDNSSTFLALNARKRVEVIIWELLQRIKDDHYNAFLVDIAKKYEKIEIISSILYWFEQDKTGKTIDGRKQKMQILYQEMGDAIISNSINLYEDIYYSPKNIWGLVRLYRDDKLIIKEYIKEIINEKTVFRLIYDIIGVSYGTKYTYSISKDNLNYFISEEYLDQLVKKAIPVTKDQQFVLDVYYNHKNDIKDDWGEPGLVTDEERNPVL
jgi:hypothetical protein